MTSLSKLKGLGPARLKALAEENITTVEALLKCLPVDYRDMNKVRPLSELRAGEAAALHVQIVGYCRSIRKGNLHITKVLVTDGTETLEAIWFNQPWLQKNLLDGSELTLYGKVSMFKGKLVLQCPIIETRKGIVPIYRSIAGIPPKTFAGLIDNALDMMEGIWEDDLPRSLRMRYGLCAKDFAMRTAHKPLSPEDLEAARRSLAFEELLLYQIALRLAKGRDTKGVVIENTVETQEEFWKTLKFAPTNAQRRTLREIGEDLAGPHAMARLVQGDVGSGKTAEAFGALYMAAKAGWQGALMAPTEILATQHYESAKETLEPLGIKCGLLTGSMTQKQHKIAHEAIASGEWQVIIGTHALVTENVQYKKLGLAITDEQHRFGVRHRTLLSSKGDSPNVLVMSATPIPRTMALILYGDLDISVIDELPPGRTPIKTRIVPAAKRKDMFGFLRREVEKGRQIYFVCPLVEESEAVDAKPAEDVYKELCENDLPDLRIGLVHGRMRPAEKDAVLTKFHAGEIDVLVSTTVIEVGVNVPNASVMVVENAERFGLAQLHQLRGRVGRGTNESWCFLMGESNPRLKLLTETNDGFVIAKKDMELRGTGEIFGYRQTGTEADGALSVAADALLLKETHDAAAEIVQNSDSEESQQVFAAAKRLLAEKIQMVGMN